MYEVLDLPNKIHEKVCCEKKKEKGKIEKRMKESKDEKLKKRVK